MFSVQHIRNPGKEVVQVITDDTAILDQIEAQLCVIHDCNLDNLRITYVSREPSTILTIHDVMDLDDFQLVLHEINEALKTVVASERKRR